MKLPALPYVNMEDAWYYAFMLSWLWFDIEKIIAHF